MNWRHCIQTKEYCDSLLLHFGYKSWKAVGSWIGRDCVAVRRLWNSVVFWLTNSLISLCLNVNVANSRWDELKDVKNTVLGVELVIGACAWLVRVGERMDFCPTCANLLLVENPSMGRPLRYFCPTCPYIYVIDRKVLMLLLLFSFYVHWSRNSVMCGDYPSMDAHIPDVVAYTLCVVAICFSRHWSPYRGDSWQSN